MCLWISQGAEEDNKKQSEIFFIRENEKKPFMTDAEQKDLSGTAQRLFEAVLEMVG